MNQVDNRGSILPQCSQPPIKCIASLPRIYYLMFFTFHFEDCTQRKVMLMVAWGETKSLPKVECHIRSYVGFVPNRLPTWRVPRGRWLRRRAPGQIRASQKVWRPEQIWLKLWFDRVPRRHERPWRCVWVSSNLLLRKCHHGIARVICIIFCEWAAVKPAPRVAVFGFRSDSCLFLCSSYHGNGSAISDNVSGRNLIITRKFLACDNNKLLSPKLWPAW